MPAPRMTPQEARDHLARLGISQQAFARLIRVNPTTARRWLYLVDPLDIPGAVEILLRILTPTKARQLLQEAGEEPIDATAPLFRARRPKRRRAKPA